MIRTVGGRDVASFDRAHVGPGSCPACGNPGISVSRLVMRAALPRELQGDFAREGFSFCPTPSCPLGYYDNARSAYVHKDELRIVIGRKSAGPDAPVCYCLRVTEGQIVDEVVAKGCCRTLDQVAEATGALLGKACHIVNPSGQCCGPEVKATIAKALRLAGFDGNSAEMKTLIAENVDHCRSRFGLGEPSSDDA